VSEFSAALPPDEVSGDIGDQAQRLQQAEEQEAIAAALSGHVGGNDDVDRDSRVDILEGDEPGASALEGDSSDDPVHGGADVTGQELDDINPDDL
jgi:hypothetical protein